MQNFTQDMLDAINDDVVPLEVAVLRRYSAMVSDSDYIDLGSDEHEEDGACEWRTRFLFACAPNTERTHS
jgi:hypothetical protein